jgi:chromosome segregation ATPase
MQLIALVMDGLVLLFLSATMVFAWHLSRNIKIFRNSRKEMEKLLQDLSRQIEKAERATHGMNNSAKGAGKDLQDVIDEARRLSEELQLMTESGDNLASRLERLAERNRDAAERIEVRGGKTAGISTKEPALPRVQESKRAPIGPSFAIRDRDQDDRKTDGRDVATRVDAEIDDDFSRAERELMAALKMGSKP